MDDRCMPCPKIDVALENIQVLYERMELQEILAQKM